MTPLIRALIVDDHHIVRRGLAALLVPRSGVEVVGEAATGREAVVLAAPICSPTSSSWTWSCRRWAASKPLRDPARHPGRAHPGLEQLR